MAADTFHLKVFTPAGLVLEDTVSAVTLPSANGQVGILPGHTKYVTTLGIGVAEYTSSNDDRVKRFVVAGGFATYSADTLSILADMVATAETVDRAGYAAERSQLEEVVTNGSAYAPEYPIAREKLARIEAIDEMLKQ